MKKVTLFLNIIRNKYLLSIGVFAVWILFFDRNDLITQWDRKKELQKLETSKEYYETEIKSTKKELADLDRDTKVLEKFAREKFFLKRPNEDVFIIVDSTEIKN
jgi:cell division protein DivIC